MALTKTTEEIDLMREGGHLLSRALGEAVKMVKPGVLLSEIDAVGERVIREGGGTPSFKGYQSDPSDTPFPSTICISLNQEIVHGLGNRSIPLKEGDVVGLDIGCWFKGLCTDMAVTVPVGSVSSEIMMLIQQTKAALLDGVNVARVGGTIKDISHAIEQVGKRHGYGIVRSLVGHGVGHAVHEAPHVPNFVSHQYPEVTIVPGMCLALEPMFGLGGDHRVETGEDGWCIVMSDQSVGAHFEVTIAVTEAGVEILTPLPV